MMKVAYYIGSMNQGGAEALLLDICRNHQQAPFNMVVLHRKKGLLWDDFNRTGVPIVQLQCNWNPLHHLLELRQFLRQQHPDVIHAQTSLCALYAVLATVGTKTRVVTSFHGLGFNKADALRKRIVFSGSAQLVFVSQQTQAIFLHDVPQIDSRKCHVVYNGISFEKFKLREVRYHPDKLIRMGMVGSFRSARNQFFICQFLKRLRSEGVLFHFDFVGSRCLGEEACFDDCVNFCRENGLDDCVSFLGARKDVPQLLDTWDAYLYATHFDTFGISVVEAIAVGLPVFVNDWPVASEVTQEGRCAILYRTGDTDDLLDKFYHFLSHRQQYEVQAIEHAVEIRQLFGIQQHINNICQVYNNSLQ